GVQRPDGQPGDQPGEPQAHHREDDQRPHGRADRPDLGPLGHQQVTEADAPSGVYCGRGGGGGRDCRHGVISPPWAGPGWSAPAGAGRGWAGPAGAGPSAGPDPPASPGAAGVAAPNSALSAVSSMKASSSDASRGVSSCRTIPSAAASSPIRGASIPVTLSPA